MRDLLSPTYGRGISHQTMKIWISKIHFGEFENDREFSITVEGLGRLPPQPMRMTKSIILLGDTRTLTIIPCGVLVVGYVLIFIVQIYSYNALRLALRKKLFIIYCKRQRRHIAYARHLRVAR
jgi:hypothetical protein